jgi:hypothetical protein
MADASVPETRTIAAVLADMHGTLVTKSKAPTPRDRGRAQPGPLTVR